MEATVEAAVDPAKAAGTTVAGLAKVERVMAGGAKSVYEEGTTWAAAKEAAGTAGTAMELADAG